MYLPSNPDITAWQEDIWKRLQECDATAPKFEDDRRYLTVICSTRYHEMVMHLFRPTPHIRNPDERSLVRCREIAERTIGLWRELYEADKMAYPWITIHSVCLSALTILYCVWNSQAIAGSMSVDQFASLMCDTSALLSAAGEYWIEARRSRTRLDNLARATTRWLMDKFKATATGATFRQRTHASRNMSILGDSMPETHQDDLAGAQRVETNLHGVYGHESISQTQASGGASNDRLPTFDLGFDGYITNQDLASFLGAPNMFTTDNNFLMEGMFVDYQPLFELNSADSGMPWSF